MNETFGITAIPTLWQSLAHRRQLQLVPFLGCLAAEAGKMTSVTGLLLINLHNPVEVAKCIASLDAIWRGNFVFAWGWAIARESSMRSRYRRGSA